MDFRVGGIVHLVVADRIHPTFMCVTVPTVASFENKVF